MPAYSLKGEIIEPNNGTYTLTNANNFLKFTFEKPWQRLNLQSLPNYSSIVFNIIAESQVEQLALFNSGSSLYLLSENNIELVTSPNVSLEVLQPIANFSVIVFSNNEKIIRTIKLNSKKIELELYFNSYAEESVNASVVTLEEKAFLKSFTDFTTHFTHEFNLSQYNAIDFVLDSTCNGMLSLSLSDGNSEHNIITNLDMSSQSTFVFGELSYSKIPYLSRQFRLGIVELNNKLYVVLFVGNALMLAEKLPFISTLISVRIAFTGNVANSIYIYKKLNLSVLNNLIPSDDGYVTVSEGAELLGTAISKSFTLTSDYSSNISLQITTDTEECTINVTKENNTIVLNSIQTGLPAEKASRILFLIENNVLKAIANENSYTICSGNFITEVRVLSTCKIGIPIGYFNLNVVENNIYLPTLTSYIIELNSTKLNNKRKIFTEIANANKQTTRNLIMFPIISKTIALFGANKQAQSKLINKLSLETNSTKKIETKCKSNFVITSKKQVRNILTNTTSVKQIMKALPTFSIAFRLHSTFFSKLQVSSLIKSGKTPFSILLSLGKVQVEKFNTQKIVVKRIINKVASTKLISKLKTVRFSNVLTNSTKNLTKATVKLTNTIKKFASHIANKSISNRMTNKNVILQQVNYKIKKVYNTIIKVGNTIQKKFLEVIKILNKSPKNIVKQYSKQSLLKAPIITVEKMVTTTAIALEHVIKTIDFISYSSANKIGIFIAETVNKLSGKTFALKKHNHENYYKQDEVVDSAYKLSGSEGIATNKHVHNNYVRNKELTKVGNEQIYIIPDTKTLKGFNRDYFAPKKHKHPYEPKRTIDSNGAKLSVASQASSYLKGNNQADIAFGNPEIIYAKTGHNHGGEYAKRTDIVKKAKKLKSGSVTYGLENAIIKLAKAQHEHPEYKIDSIKPKLAVISKTSKIKGQNFVLFRYFFPRTNHAKSWMEQINPKLQYLLKAKFPNENIYSSTPLISNDKVNLNFTLWFSDALKLFNEKYSETKTYDIKYLNSSIFGQLLKKAGLNIDNSIFNTVTVKIPVYKWHFGYFVQKHSIKYLLKNYPRYVFVAPFTFAESLEQFQAEIIEKFNNEYPNTLQILRLILKLKPNEKLEKNPSDMVSFSLGSMSNKEIEIFNGGFPYNILVLLKEEDKNV